MLHWLDGGHLSSVELNRWAAALTLALIACSASTIVLADPPAARLTAGAVKPSWAVDRHLRWVLEWRDNESKAFGILDKRDARLWLFDAQGNGVATTPVLLGSARGDASVPGIGERALQDVRPHERTTPAGRFVLEAGFNTLGEDVLWIDYEAAVSMHRVRATKPAERRLERLATPTAADNRISYGCVNVPSSFFDLRVKPHFRGHRGVMYVLPESLPATRLFTPTVFRTVRDERDLELTALTQRK